jgi:general secretion pathway protein D
MKHPGLWKNIKKNCVRICVLGGQGSPQAPKAKYGQAETPGSSMNRRAQALAASESVFSSAAFRIAFFSVLAVVALSSVPLRAQSANTWFKRGEDAEARKDYDTAIADFQKATAKAPKDITYTIALNRLQVTASAAHISKGRKLLQAGDDQGALAEFLHAAEIDPGNEAAQQEIAKVRQKQSGAVPLSETSLPMEPNKQEEINSIAGPPELKPLSNEPLTLHMTEDAKVIYQAIGKAAGINILFDPDYVSKRTEVDLNNVSLVDALRIVGTMTNTFWRPITSNAIFVAANTRAKRTELDEAAVETFYLTNAWQQNDMNDVQTALRNVLPGAKVYGVASQNAIVMRGTPDELLLAQKLINDLDKARAEVVVDIAILEVSKNWEKTLGIAWPTNVGVALQSPTSSTSTTTSTTSTTGTSTGVSPTLYDLSHLKASDFAVTIGSATANLLLTDANTKVLQSPRIRATDAQKATMKIGERIPIATGSYSTGVGVGVTGAATGMMGETQFQYIDVGVNIEMTPTIHYDGDVTLKIKIEDSSEGSPVTIEGVTEPIIIQKVVEQVIRLREGEASILGGIQEKQDTVNWTGIPGLSSIPILKYLFGSKDHTITDDELVFLVVPHIVRTQMLDIMNLRTVDTGAGTSVELRHVPSEEPVSMLAPTAAPEIPAVIPQSTLGTVSGQSAAEAAPAALAQMGVASRGTAAAAAPAALAQIGSSSRGTAAAAAPAALAQIGSSSGGTAAAAAPAALAQIGSSSGGTAAAAAPAALASHPPVPPVPPIPPIPSEGAISNPAAADTGHPSVLPPVGVVNLMLTPPQSPVPLGTTFKVPVVLGGGTNIASVPMQIQYDPAKLSLVNVDMGDFLGQGGQAVTLIHRDDGPGSITINAARPPGAVGVSGAGVVCVLSFQAKAAGESVVAITRPGAVNSAQQQVPAQGSQLSIVVK